MRQWFSPFVFGAIAGAGIGAVEHLWLVGIAIFLIMFLYIRPDKNKSLYAKLLAVPIGLSFAGWLPLSTLYDVYDWILTITNWFCMEKLFRRYTICSVIVIVSTLTLVIIYYYCHEAKLMKHLYPEPPSWHNLFPERVDDLNWLIAQLRNPRIYAIGLEGPWGSGKSYLVEGLAVWWQIHGKAKEYELITIDVLAVTFDDLAEYMVKELDDVLYRHHILSKYSRHLKEFFRGNTLSSFYALWLPKESSYAKIFAGFREELLALGKIIVINFEDIDRIKTGRNLRKVFYLAEKLSNSKERRENGGCIKVIYQYDKHKMENLGFGLDYLEKYVQQRLCLTRLDFIQIVQAYNEQEKDAGHSEILSEHDMYRLPPYVFVSSDKRVDNMEVLCRQYFSGRITIRGVEHFLIDIQQSMEQDNYIKTLSKGADARDVIIAFYFIKRFMPAVYDLFDTNVPLGECFYIDAEYDKVRIDDLFARPDWKTKVFQCYCLPEEHPLNFEKYVAYLLLGMDRIRR